jgi:uncharacterized membrane protein
VNKGRVEAFSDGVFAVAITILVFNIQTPKVAPGGLWHALGAEWPSYAAYVASFLTIGIMWINHHAVFERIARVDRTLLFINLFLLMGTVLVPYPTALVGQFVLGGGADARAAATVYALLMTVNGAIWQLLWGYALTHPAVLIPQLDRTAAVRAMPRFAIGAVLYLASIPLAQVSPIAVVFLLAAAAIFYGFEHLPDIDAASRGEDEPGSAQVT